MNLLGIGDIYVGAKLKLVPMTLIDKCGATAKQKRPCVVIGIHKRHRYFRVRFTFPNGYSFAESYKFSLPGDRAVVMVKHGHHKPTK